MEPVDHSVDEALMATVLTALLIREGGRFTMLEDEWRAAIRHESTIWMEKSRDGEVLVALIPRKDVIDG